MGRGPDLEQALERLKVDVDRLAAREDGTREEREAGTGETLFAVVEVAAAVGVDPELALRAASKRSRAQIGEDTGSLE